MNLSLLDALGKFGAKRANRLRGLSAIAADGAVVLNCSHPRFAHPTRGVLRYEDKLSREMEGDKDSQLLGQHLALARGGDLPDGIFARASPQLLVLLLSLDMWTIRARRQQTRRVDF